MRPPTLPVAPGNIAVYSTFGSEGSEVKSSGGRTWWAPFEFTRMNITPTILHKKIEDWREARGSISMSVALDWGTPA
jgi:hypothetical protein